MARQPLLVLRPDLTDEICRLLSVGVPIDKVCERFGIAESSYYNWIKRGQVEHDRRSEQRDPDRKRLGKREKDIRQREQPFLEFLERATRARAEAFVGAVAELRRAMHPTETVTEATETFTETRLDRQGEPYEYKRTTVKRSVTKSPGNWRAALEFLKRADPTNWSEHTVQKFAGVIATSSAEERQTEPDDGPSFAAQVFEILAEAGALKSQPSTAGDSETD